MREVTSVHQSEGESHRRWFSDDYFDLIVWEDEDGLKVFQLAYDKKHNERVIEWREDQGLSHFRVDRAGERPARHARTGFLEPSDAEGLDEVVTRFEEAASGIDPQVALEVLTRLWEGRHRSEPGGAP